MVPHGALGANQAWHCAAGLIVCVRGIVAGKLTVGDAVLFLSLMQSLMAPLSFFGSYYRQVSSEDF